MPTSRVKYVGTNANFEDCTFRSLTTGLPPQITKMLRRAFDSFGPDVKVLPKWNRPVRTPKGEVEERNFFPHAPGVDICCADGVAFTLYQTGCLDLGMDKKAFRPSHKDYGFHLAAYWLPHAGNADVARCVTEIRCPVDIAELEQKMKHWLPGDYFVYWPPGKERPAHVNVYLGPFVETTPEGDLEKVYDVLNSSIGAAGPHAFIKASTFIDGSVRGAPAGKRIFHCRLVEVEKLYKNTVGVPVHLGAKGQVAEEGVENPRWMWGIGDVPHPSEVPWILAESLGSPYPIGRSMTWHGGIHLVPGGEKDDVLAMGPGEVIVSGKGKITNVGDSYFVLMQHRYVPDEQRVLPNRPLRDDEEDDASAKKAKPLYSLYMQMTPPRWSGVVKRENALPGLNEHAPSWLRRCWYREVPPREKAIDVGAPITLLGLTRVAGKTDPELRPIRGAPSLTVRELIRIEGATKIDAGGTGYYLVPVETTNASLWNHKVPPPVTAPSKATLCFFNPATGELLRTSINVGKHATLRYRMVAGHAVLASVEHRGKPQTTERGELVRIDAYKQPGFDMVDFLHVPVRPKKGATPDAARKKGAPSIANAKTTAVDAATQAAGDAGDGVVDLYDWYPLSGADRGRLHIHDGTKPVLLHVDSTGDGPERELTKQTVDLRKLGVTLVFQGTRAETGGRKPLDRMFPELVACVELTAEQAKSAREELDDTSWSRETHARLAAGLATIAGVKISAKSGFTLAGGVVTVAEGTTSDPLLYRSIKVKDKKRIFEEPSAPGASEEDEDHVALSVDHAATDTALVPLGTPGKTDSTALVYIALGVAEKHVGDNKSEIDAANAINEKRKPAIEALLRDEVVDWRKVETITRADRAVQRDPIGKVGQVLGIEGQTKGLHFEVFSGENLVDPEVPGENGKIVKVPKTGWVVYRDESVENLVSPDFVAKLLKALHDFPHQAILDHTQLREANGKQVLTPAEWVRFAKDRHNHRALSRIITAFPSEWRVRWTEQAKPAPTGLARLLHQGEKPKERLKSDEETLRWWLPELSLDGISSDVVYHYHPLRFIETLSTGLDISVGFAKGDKVSPPKIRLEVLEGGEPDRELVYDKAADVYRFRTFLGEARAHVLSRLTIDGLATATPKFRTRIHRGDITTIRLTRPRAELSMMMDQPVVSYAMPVSQKGVGSSAREVHVLADGNKHLEDCGYSKSTFLVNVFYNVRGPETIDVEVTGDSGFDVSVRDPKSLPYTVEKSGRTLKLTVKAETRDPQVPPDETVVLQAASGQVAIDVTGRTTKIGASAKIVAKVKGGDLPSEVALEGSVTTRKITAGDSGEDVGKVQLYLSQLLALDDLPCYRDTGKGEANAASPAGEVTGSVTNGSYGGSTARALWRFIYHYAFEKDCGWKATSIHVTDAKGGGEHTVQLSELTELKNRDVLRAPPPEAPKPPSKKQAAGAMTAWLETFEAPVRDALRRTASYEANAWQCPVIDEALIAELVRCFEPPWALPSVDVDVTKTVLPDTAGPTVVLPKDGDAWNKKASTTAFVLPLPEIHEKLTLKAKWTYADDEKGDFPIVLRVAETSAYRFAGGALERKMEFREMLADEHITLSWSGRVTAKGDDNTLRILTAKHGRTIALRPLPGCRDLSVLKKADIGRDAALVAFWLSRVPDPKSPGYTLYCSAPKESSKKKGVSSGPPPLTANIDGRWSDALHAALSRFRAELAPAAAEWPALVAALRAAATTT